MTRKYAPLWIKLKTSSNKEVSFVAPIAAHKRIKKALEKEKDLDSLFKLEQLNENQKWRLKFSQSFSNPLKITVKLALQKDCV